MRVCNVRLPSTLKMVMGLLVTAAVVSITATATHSTLFCRVVPTRPFSDDPTRPPYFHTPRSCPPPSSPSLCSFNCAF